jgi:LysR family nitrogen assimilation transcriptional regulator
MEERRMDIQRLRAFLYAAQLGSISRAATQLRIAQPALSRQIQKLEEELGVALLVRQGRGVRPTEAGAMLVRKGEPLLRQIQDTADEVVASAGVATGTVGFAVPPGAGKTLGPSLVMRYRERCPNVTLRIMSGLSGQIRQWLVNGQVDVALMHNPSRLPDVTLRPILAEDHYVIAPPSAAMAKLPRGLRALPRIFHTEDLARLPLILPGRPHSLRVFVEEIAARHGLALDVLEVENLELIKTLVEAGVGFSVMAFNAVQSEVKRRTLRAIPLDPPVGWTLALATPNRPATRATTELVHLVQALVDEMVTEGVWRGRLLKGTV